MKTPKLNGKTIRDLMAASDVSIEDLAKHWDSGQPGRGMRLVEDALVKGVTGYGAVCFWLAWIVRAKPVFESLVWKVRLREDILEHYENDLLVHDRRQIGTMVKGDEFLWVGRQSCSVLLVKGGLGLAVEHIWCRSPEIGALYAHVRVEKVVEGIVFGEIRWLGSAEARRLAEGFTRPAIKAAA